MTSPSEQVIKLAGEYAEPYADPGPEDDQKSAAGSQRAQKGAREAKHREVCEQLAARVAVLSVEGISSCSS